jgi:diamine N-acetyltransferase
LVSLREISKENFWDCVSLEVGEDQKEFVTSNAISLAQSKYQPECIPLGVFNGEEMVGFVMYCIDADDGEYWIYRMMIDRARQSRGLGTKALGLLVERIKQDRTRHCIMLGVHRESRAAVALYERNGFKFTGQVFGSEHIMKYEY